METAALIKNSWVSLLTATSENLPDERLQKWPFGCVFKKVIFKLLEYSERNVHYGERLKQSCTYDITEVIPRNGWYPRNYPKIY